MGRALVLQHREASASGSVWREGAPDCRPAKARGAAERRAPAARCPFPAAAERGRETRLDSESRGGRGGARGDLSGELLWAAGGPRGARAPGLSSQATGGAGSLRGQGAPARARGRVPAFGHPGAALVRPGPLPGRAGRAHRARHAAPGWEEGGGAGAGAPGRR